MRKIVPVLFIIFQIQLTYALQAQEQHKGFYGSIGASYDVMFTESRTVGENGTFDFYIGGFTVVSLEFGRQLGKHNIGGIASFGSNPNPLDLDPDLDFNGDIDLLNMFELGLIYRKQFSKLRKSEKLILNLGYRASLAYYRYTGDRLFIDEDRTGRFEEFTLNLGGVESGIYIELGKTPVGKKPEFFLNLEPMYVRITNDGFGIGALKLNARLKF